MNAILYMLIAIGIVLLAWLAACLGGVILGLAPPKKRRVNIFEEAQKIIAEAPEGAILSVSVTLVCNTGAVIELTGPPKGPPKEEPPDKVPNAE
jgi:hypothetical protein